MFVIIGTYTRPFDRTDPLVSEHLAFIDRCYDDGLFVASGPRHPFTGGLIIARGDDESRLRALLAEDPFTRAAFAEYEVLQFTPSRAVDPVLLEGEATRVR